MQSSIYQFSCMDYSIKKNLLHLKFAFKILNIEQILPGIFCHIYYIALQNFFVNEKKTDVKIFIAVHLFF